jgi:asparagine synthase (glutamine-hydrolysing)
MPGIVGIISAQPAAECQRLVNEMVKAMSHEPFYVSDTVAAPELRVYGGLVAIANTPALQKVATNATQDLVLLLAGECWVDDDPGDDMVAALFRGYEKHGDKFFEKLNGNFSALLIDKRKKLSFLFNDRYGMERIHVYESAEGIFFASEAKALLRIVPQTRVFDPDGVAQYLAYGCTIDWRTLFCGVHLLPGGSLWSFNFGKVHKGKYFSPDAWERQGPLSTEEFEQKFQQVFKGVLPHYLRYSSRLGIALTGGLDTRMIMACLPEMSPGPICYTFTGEKGMTNDDKIAIKVAQACHLEHRLIRMGPDFFSNFGAHLDRTVHATDGCSGLTGTHEIYFNRQGRELSPVRLTGVFGSEVFRGISTFHPLGIARNLLAPELRQATVTYEREKTPGGDCNGNTFAAFREAPWHLAGNLYASRSQVFFRTPYLNNRLVELAYQTPQSLRASPRAALRLVGDNHKVLRSIVTDRQVGGTAGPLRNLVNRFFSQVLFKVDYYYSDGMPDRLTAMDPVLEGVNSVVPILGHHKYLHYRIWLRKRLAPFVRERLSDPSILGHAFWNREFLDQLADSHIKGKRNCVQEIGAVLTLNSIERQLFKN